jgi:heme-degrading monooxygenase HmoA
LSVIMTMQLDGDAAALERIASDDREAMQGILERAKAEGLIAHRFYGSDDGRLMVIDEWPDAESFQRFFQGSRAQIEPLLSGAGRSEPQISFWHKLETHDEYGWGA